MLPGAGTNLRPSARWPVGQTNYHCLQRSRVLCSQRGGNRRGQNGTTAFLGPCTTSNKAAPWLLKQGSSTTKHIQVVLSMNSLLQKNRDALRTKSSPECLFLT